METTSDAMKNIMSFLYMYPGTSSAVLNSILFWIENICFPSLNSSLFVNTNFMLYIIVKKSYSYKREKKPTKNYLKHELNKHSLYYH